MGLGSEWHWIFDCKQFAPLREKFPEFSSTLRSIREKSFEQNFSIDASYNTDNWLISIDINSIYTDVENDFIDISYSVRDSAGNINVIPRKIYSPNDSPNFYYNGVLMRGSSDFNSHSLTIYNTDILTKNSILDNPWECNGFPAQFNGKSTELLISVWVGIV